MSRADPLAEYNRKRDFKKTAEPAGKRAAGEGGNRFIVQKHDASRLHWDLRLEADGVLKSWAVTKGPSPDPEIKRLAVRTEDHPMAYAEFEGIIPAGEYGGGTVMLWDKGTWAPVPGKSWKDIDKGHLHFTLEGERMNGEWLLIRLRGKPGEKRENWLLRKLQDEHAAAGDPLVEQCLTSVLTGRSMAEIAGDPKGAYSLKGVRGDKFTAVMAKAAKRNKSVAKGGARKAPAKRSQRLPGFRPPQLATLVDAVPAGNGWLHEIKFDGYRALVACAGSEVRVYTRKGLDWSDKFAPLVERLKALDLPPCLIDGEIVAYDAGGNPDFSALQSVLKRGHGSQKDSDKLSFHAFDLLELDGKDLTGLTNIERKERLEALLGDAKPPIHVADHVIGAGEKLYTAMCRAGQEGIISKTIDGRYRPERTRNWVKVKCTLRQEFVLIGWKKSTARGRPFSSLLLAQHEKGKLVYKGNVGTGFNADTLRELAATMKPLERRTAPAEVGRPESRGVTWLEPTLVAEIAFAEFTHDGSVRHGSFVGLRSDKKADDVVPEKAVEAPAEELIAISNRERVIFPESGQTKGELADYYAAVAPLMLPWAAGRPVSLVRCPQGRAKKCFFQKHDSGSFGEHVHHVPITEKDGHAEDYLYIDDAAGILACVQMGTIEFHGWGSKVADVEAPDRMVFDLDPDVGLDFGAVKQAASDIRDRLADLGLASFAMLSGGKGVHVVVPLTSGHSWEAHKDFAYRFAEALATAEPERFTANMSKAKRTGRIFVDYLRNQRGSTAVLPYSARARENAPVALPIAWSELKAMKDAHPFGIRDATRLIERAADKMLVGWGFTEQALPEF